MMFSPYEELEYLSDHLPDEGESVLISRQSGELVCKPLAKPELRDGIDDADLYGLLVRSSEQLHIAGAFPLWMTLISMTWLIIMLYGVFGIGWDRWYLIPMISVSAVYACSIWIQQRQSVIFSDRILPQIKHELTRRNVSFYSLIAGVRQHSELRTLLDELIRWTPERTRSPREKSSIY